MIIGLTGRIAAGKETLTSFLRDKGFIYLESSKLLSEELVKRGIEVNRTNQQNLGDEWRKAYGPGALMKKFLDRVEPDKNYIIDSLRNHHEAEFLRATGIKFFLIAVDAPQKIRFERILKRGKPSDPKTWEDFLKVDNRDFDSGDNMGQNVKKCMETADFIIVNDDSLSDSMKRIQEIWEKIQSS
jgi:dephospho-CoA kinase